MSRQQAIDILTKIKPELVNRFGVTEMKEEYDFSNAEQGKFYVPLEDIQIPIYLDKDIVQYLTDQCRTSPENLQVLVNDLLRKDIEITRRVTS